ncbi:MAG: 50S ribosomal protein L4 [Thaumarchaeota archaeon]|nr:50S ribosomal protein L4 [Nitrososphaerota archaeon]
MNVQVYSLDGKIVDELELPKVFSTPYRPDVIHKAFISLQSHSFQPQGRDPLAGEKTSAMSRNTGQGIARMARVKGSGFPRAGQAAGVGNTIKGRQAHPPMSNKNITKRLNKKEKRLALCSAIAATISKEIVASRGHSVDKIKDLPLVINDDICKIKKTKDLQNVMNSLNLSDDIERVRKGWKKRMGKSQRRGRVTRASRSVLIVVDKDEGIGKATGSILGIDVTTVKNLSVLHLAPGSHAARLVLWSKGAIEHLNSFTSPVLEIMELINK